MATEDPRIKRVLKRYLKGEEYSSDSMDVTGIGLENLQSACRCDSDGFRLPKELDGYALVCLTGWMGINFDASEYDYFIHSYVKRECVSPEKPFLDGIDLPSEYGPPTKIPRPEGTRWVSVRPDPDDGTERWVAE
jgi:hypothetical protein